MFWREKINRAEGAVTWGLPHQPCRNTHMGTHRSAHVRHGGSFVEPMGCGDVPLGDRLELDPCNPMLLAFCSLSVNAEENQGRKPWLCAEESIAYPWGSPTPGRGGPACPILPQESSWLPQLLAAGYGISSASPPRMGTPRGREQAQGRAVPSEGTRCGLCPVEHPAGEALLDSQVLVQT